jgi:hypothetical protein
MNEQDSKTTAQAIYDNDPMYDSEASIVLADGTISTAATLSHDATMASASNKKRWALEAQVRNAWQVVIDNRDSLTREFAESIAEALGKSLTCDVIVKIHVGDNGEHGEFVICDVDIDTDLNDLAEQISNKVSISAPKVEVSVCGWVGDSDRKWLDSVDTYDVEVTLDENDVQIEVTCEWDTL